MKKHLILSMFLCAVALLTGCKEKTSLDIVHGETHSAGSEKLSQYDSLTWASDNNSIARVNAQGEIVGTGPGTAVITAQFNEKVVAEITVNVTVIPATGIVLSTNATEMAVDDGFQLNYTLFPDNASDYGISWKSADTTIAEVNENGYVTAKSVGQTTISVSNQDGFMATCSVAVHEKPAYERLSEQEKAFVDCVLEDISSFKNPDSVVIKRIGEKDFGDGWAVTISAMNGFGGMTITDYYLDEDLGFWNWDMLDINIDITVNASDAYDIALINEAIHEKL